MGKSDQTIEKMHNYPSVQKGYSTSHKGIGHWKKIAKISRSKTATLTYFDNLKKKQQDQGSNSWCYAFVMLKFYVTGNFKSQNYCFLFWKY